MATQMMGVRLTEREEEEIRRLVVAGMFVSASEFIRDSVRKNIAMLKAIELRPVSKTAAKKEILAYLRKRKEAYASDIAEELQLDLDLVFTVMKELASEGVVE
jgi:Arc/MetJ-type ribon-helix-helix transcriptional regulator